MSAVSAVSQSSFATEVLGAETPVVVDFWAEWCGPCKMLAPVVDKLAASYTGRVKFVKIDTDENPDISGQFGIRGIPCLIMFKGGKEIDRFVGYDSGAKIDAMIAKHS